MRSLCIVAALTAVMSASSSGAVADDEQMPAVASTGPAALTAEDLGAFLDGFLPTALVRGDIAGATVVVVKDGAVLLQRGYGYVDVPSKQAVDPETSLFRVGSVAKLLTWTAVMQLVERGALDLDRDINAYLDFEIEPRFGEPITARHLLTHTAGFEETLRNFFLEDPARLAPLGQYLEENTPARIFPPGKVVAYSNYGAALAGYVVERISGKPFNSYVNEHILRPLGMSRTTLEQPLPQRLQPFMSKAYDQASDRNAQPFEIGQAWPAGSATASAYDMARFMLAYLNGGSWNGQRILAPQTVRTMHERAYSTVPAADMNGMALGFYQEDRNGWRVFGHAGDTRWFHSNLELVVDAGVGMFISMNSNGRDGASDAIRFSLFHAFMDRYFPARAAQALPTTATAREHGRELAGTYLSSRRWQTTYFSLINLFAQATVRVVEDDLLEIDSVRGFDGQPLRWREIEPYVWQQVDGQGKLAALRDSGGRITAIATSDGPPVAAFQQAPWYLNQTWTLPALIASLATLALALALWPVAALIRRTYGVQPDPRQHRTVQLVRLTTFANLAFLSTWLWLLLAFGEHVTLFNDSLDPWLRALQLLGVLGLAGTTYVLVQAVRSWRDPATGMWTKLGQSAVACACTTVAWFSLVCHLLSFSLR